MTKYCKKYFYPERYVLHCKDGKLHHSYGLCNNNCSCEFKLDMNPTEHAILDSLRVVKEQNQEILFQLTGKTK